MLVERLKSWKMFLRTVFHTTLVSLAAAQTITLQAESATLSGVTVGSSVAGYTGKLGTLNTSYKQQHRSNIVTGTGYVEGFDTATDRITFTFNATDSKLYDLSLIYNGPYGDKVTTIVLNSAGGSQVSLPATTAWTTVPAGQVLLSSGANTIEIQNNWGWYLIDAITLTPSASRPAHNVITVPVTLNANADAKALLKYIGSIYGKQILSGQQDQASFDWVVSNVGKTPAILGTSMSNPLYPKMILC